MSTSYVFYGRIYRYMYDVCIVFENFLWRMWNLLTIFHLYFRTWSHRAVYSINNLSFLCVYTVLEAWKIPSLTLRLECIFSLYGHDKAIVGKDKQINNIIIYSSSTRSNPITKETSFIILRPKRSAWLHQCFAIGLKKIYIQNVGYIKVTVLVQYVMHACVQRIFRKKKTVVLCVSCFRLETERSQLFAYMKFQQY